MTLDPNRPSNSLSHRITALMPLLALAALCAVPANAQIAVIGDSPANGIFDPSVEYAPGNGEGWLAYSAVFGGGGGGVPWGPIVETHLARTTDGGASWTFETVVNASFAGQVDVQGEGLVDGYWNYETPSIVYDPGDTGAEWKIFTHRIFRRTTGTHETLPPYSWISMKTAPHPSGPWSAEIGLFESSVLPFAPWNAFPTVNVSALDPALSSYILYSEPGAFAKDGTLYVSLAAITNAPAAIVVIASDDHGATWRYVGTALDPSDATSLGYVRFDGSALAEDDGRVFLMVTPETASVIHDGTLVFEFADLTTASLVRSSGTPVIHLNIPAQPGLPVDRRGGQADYHEGNTAGGLLHPALRTDLLPEMFTFSSTGLHLVVAPVPGIAATGGLALLATLVGVGVRSAGKRNRA